VYKISVQKEFSAAHQLIGYEGACENLHGHNWIVRVEVEAKELNSLGMGFDFKELKKILADTIEILDHQLLNKVPPFDEINPTAENIACFIHDKIKECLPETVNMSAVQVSESPTSTVTYTED